MYWFERGRGRGRKRQRQRERETETPIFCPAQLCTHWLTPMCALPRDRKVTLAHSDEVMLCQQSHLARAVPFHSCKLSFCLISGPLSNFPQIVFYSRCVGPRGGTGLLTELPVAALSSNPIVAALTFRKASCPVEHSRFLFYFYFLCQCVSCTWDWL